MINSRDKLSGHSFTRFTRSFICRLTFARYVISFRIRFLTCLTSFIFTLFIRIMSNFFFSHVRSKRATVQDFRTSYFTVSNNFKTSICYGTGALRWIFNRARRPIMVFVLCMRFCTNRLEVVIFIRPFIARIFPSFVRAFGSTCSRSLRVGFNDSARMGIRIREVVIDSRKANAHSAKSKLRDQDFCFNVSNFVRCNARHSSGNNALRRYFFCALIRGRICVTLTVTRFKVFGEIMHRAVFMFCGEWQFSELNRCDRLFNVSASFTRLYAGCGAFSSSGIAWIRRTFRCTIMRLFVFSQTRIIANSMRLCASFKVLRFGREYFTRGTTARRASNCKCRTKFIFIFRFLFCVNERDVNCVLYYKVELGTRHAGLVRAITSSSFLFA